MASPPIGTVFLVGAGPGDPMLITLRAVQCLNQADVVVHDRLVNRALLDHAPATARRIDVGKTPGSHAMAQDRINALLIDLARQGQRVVRLKGGDPFVFGRGGEEALALAQAGIPFEVVPGVCAAMGAAAYAGVPLTHRGRASAAALVTGHEDPTKPDSDLDWDVLARWRGTLAIYMGLRRLPEIVHELLAHGRAPETPVAVVCRGTLPSQKTVAGTLADVVDKVRQAGLAAPVLILVGEVVTLRPGLRWFESRPLFGRTVVVTRAPEQAASLASLLEAEGAQVLRLPTIRIVPPADWTALDQALSGVATFDWLVFTSVNGIASVMGRLADLGLDVRALAGPRLAAIGPATAGSLEQHGLRVDCQPAVFRAEALADALTGFGDLAGKRILLARAADAPEALPQQLRAHGAEVVVAPAYRTDVPREVDPETLDRVRSGTVDWVTFTSSSTVRGFVHTVGHDGVARITDRVRFASIGPVTSETMQELGIPVGVEAGEHTVDALARAIASAAGTKA